jgi:hypothetical protein
MIPARGRLTSQEAACRHAASTESDKPLMLEH